MLNGALPVFDFSEGGQLLACVRGIAVALTILSFGPLFYQTRLASSAVRAMPGEAVAALRRRYRLLSQVSIAAALLAQFLWLYLESQAAADAAGVAATFRAVPTVLLSTHFGYILAAQALLLLAAAAVQGRSYDVRRTGIATAAAGLAVLLQAEHSHAASMYEGFSFLLLSQIVHIAAAAAWLGTLIPLLMLIQLASPGAAQIAARRYSVFGTRCVILLLLSAFYQGWTLIGSWPAIIGTCYGWMAIIKGAIFLALLVYAAANRFYLTPALAGNRPLESKKKIMRSISIEASIGLAIIIAAAFLAQLPPSIHEQIVWPFAQQPSLVTVSEDIDLRREVAEALGALAIAVALIGVAFILHRARIPALLLAAGIAWLAIPHLDLLLVDAYPTSFYHSPTDFSAISITNGAALFPQHCASCHGAEGRGNGPAAKGLPVPPADLTAAHLWGHSDGELFWWISHGINAPDDSPAMPGFADQLSETERWNLIDYIRANNAGLNYAASKIWPPVRAPEIQMECQDGVATLENLRGSVVRIVFGDGKNIPDVPDKVKDRLITVLVGDSARHADESQCVASDPSIAKAYAIVAGVSAASLSGAVFLTDVNGWLRAMQKPGESMSWSDPAAFAAEILTLCTHPIAAEAGHGHHHHS